MTGNYFFKDRSGAQNGPVSLEELVTLARFGRLAPDCLVWAEGGAPTQAVNMPELAAAFRNGSSGAGGFSGPIQPMLPVWGLFWRGLVFVFGLALVVTAPWAGKWFYQWLATRLALPTGRRMFLQTTLGECWYIFLGMIMAGATPQLLGEYHAQNWGPILAMLVGEIFNFLLIGWFARSLRSEDGSLNVSFEGGFPAYFGWGVLLILSFVTIVGWAWVIQYRTRWICRATRGTHSFDFVGSGWEILWRGVVAALGCIFIVTIPWALSWFYNWYISQIVATPAAASGAIAQPVAA